MTDGDQQSEELAALEKALLDESMDPTDLPFSLIKAITGNFSEAQEIGRGGYGVVYKGVLPSGHTVAVKKLFERFDILDKNFESEVACLVGVKHKNTVRLLGYCSETQHVMRPYHGKYVWAEARQRLLCFEYLPKGCLADYLYDTSCGLQWTTRYEIIKGICEGIHYLHQKHIIHMDLKPHNVLLDDNMVPRIADFGLSRFLSGSQSRVITENKLGTRGYMAPEFLISGEITFKTDIYSLGVIIMEILMGRKKCFSVKEVVENWTSKFGTSYTQIEMEQVKVCANLGIKCMDNDPVKRPATSFIIRGILVEARSLNWPATNEASTSTEGRQISFISKILFSITSFASKIVDGLKFVDDSDALSQRQLSAMGMEQEDDKVNRGRKATGVMSTISGKINFFKQAHELDLVDDYVAPTQLQVSTYELEQEDGKVSQGMKSKSSTVSVVTGVKRTFNGKLTTFMCDEYNKRKEVRKQACFLKKELSTISADLEKLELMDELTPGVKNWRDNAREISYDLENYVDDFMFQFGGEDDESGFAEDTAELHIMLCELHRIENEMEDLRTLVMETNARCESYKIDDCKPGSSSMVVDPRLSTVYQEASNLVGIDDRSKEVVNLLMNNEKELKVVSIVGSGGLGKTTLAKHVFEKIRRQFDCVAFCPVTQQLDMRVLLNGLQLKLGINESPHDHGFNEINKELSNYLVRKRYLIVVDNLWDESTWNTISHAFPENIYGSRLIVTTRVQDVARLACHNDHGSIYTMKPLNEHNSRMLFSNRVFGLEVVCPPYLKDAATEILKMCSGLPLAIITIAGLLSTQIRSRKHWESIRKSLRAQSETNVAFKEMDSILKFCYMHLPDHLRPCFLYLGMYPEGHIIPQDDLVKQWIAEGLVSSLHGQDLEDIGRIYFNELINRSMIQPSEAEYGEVVSCTVHDVMLDFILSKCAKDNFISVAYNSEHMERLLLGCKYKVRRLSLSSMVVGGATYGMAIATSLPQVRSFIIFENPIPPLWWFKYLRVLIIVSGKDIVHLATISQLFQLRYLMVRVHGRIELPAKFGKLAYLETMDIQQCKLIQSIPSDIVHLPRLSYLVLPNFTAMPPGIWNMKSLRTLKGFDLNKSSLKCIMGLSELTNMRKLSMKIHCDFGTPKVNALACSIGKLCNLEYFSISGRHFEHENDQQLGSLSNPFQHTKQLYLKWWNFCRVPKWMGGLHCLRILTMQVDETSTEEVHLLGELPSLIHLDFEAFHIPDERATLGVGLFPVLEYLRFISKKDSTAFLGFEAGAMPNLRIINLNVVHWGGTVPVGMEHLLQLQLIRIYGSPNVKSAFVQASRGHPDHPSVKWEGM